MFGTPISSKLTTLTSINNIDALLSGRQWGINTLTYSFPDSLSDYENNYRSLSDPTGAKSIPGFQSFNSVQKAATRSWISQYMSVANLNLTELTGTQDRDAIIRIAAHEFPTTSTLGGYGLIPNDIVESGDIFLRNQELNTNPKIGNYAYHAIGHELGHALGLKHAYEPSDYVINNAVMSKDRDSMEFSLLTYRSYINAPLTGYTNEIGGYAQSLMMYDIRAIQQMYGANFNSNSSNTVYRFSTTTGEMFVNGVGQGTPTNNRIFRTVWDGNGVDTYDFSNYTTNLAIDLTPGGWSDLDVGGSFQRARLGVNDYARGHVFNALQYNGDVRSLIENANGGSGNDRLIGNSANNILNGGAGADTMIGGTGNDIYVVDNAGDVVTETSTVTTEIDAVYSSVNYTLGANIESLVLTGTNATSGTGNELNNFIVGNIANNALYGGAGTDYLDSGAGTDYLDGGIGADRMIGGTGNDTYIVDNINDVVTETSTVTTETDVVRSSINYTLGANIEYLTLTGTTAISGIGNELNNSLVGNSANNILDGGAGFDYLDGGIGADRMIGGAGNDMYLVDNINDVVIETSTIVTEIDAVRSSVSYSLNATNVELLFLEGTNAINGTGNSLNNNLQGNSSSNTLDGGIGADTMIGGTGNDTYVVDNAGDIVTETSTVTTEFDTVRSSINYTLGANIEYLTLTGTAISGTGNSLDNQIIGNSANNILNGGAGNDYLDGGIGADRMIGGAGGDLYVVDDIGDVIVEESSSDWDMIRTSLNYVLDASLSVEALFLTGTNAVNGTGNSLNNQIIGNIASNIISGGAGNDTLDGGAGNDTLTGGSGTDWFYFADKTNGVDSITDFVSGTDVIGVSASGFGGSLRRTESRLDASQFLTVTSGSAATTSSQRFIYNSTNGGLFYDADGSGAGAALQFATLSSRPTLLASDLFIS
jgi:serralysin